MIGQLSGASASVDAALSAKAPWPSMLTLPLSWAAQAGLGGSEASPCQGKLHSKPTKDSGTPKQATKRRRGENNQRLMMQTFLKKRAPVTWATEDRDIRSSQSANPVRQG